jgi:hypothetical protein
LREKRDRGDDVADEPVDANSLISRIVTCTGPIGRV